MPESLKGELSYRQAKDLSSICTAELKHRYWNMHTFIVFKKRKRKKIGHGDRQKEMPDALLAWLYPDVCSFMGTEPRQGCSQPRPDLMLHYLAHLNTGCNVEH